jgi:hypothetical protein
MQEVGTMKGVVVAWISNYYLNKNNNTLCSVLLYKITLRVSTF